MTWARMPWRGPFIDESCLGFGGWGAVGFFSFLRLVRGGASAEGEFGVSWFVLGVVLLVVVSCIFAFSRFARRRASEMGHLGFSSFVSVVELPVFASVTFASSVLLFSTFSLFASSRSSELLFSVIGVISSCAIGVDARRSGGILVPS